MGTDRLDALVNVVGELVIAQAIAASLAEKAEGERAAELREALALVARNTREVQETVMALRMVPISRVFGRFPRLVRDLAAGLGKNVRLDVSGDDTEIDKAFVEQLVDPLTHLVRNAIDHGLETEGQRVAAGKPASATLSLSAWHEGGHVVIEVADDGRGLDCDRIRARALECGLLREGEQPNEARLHAMIFEPGFSTAECVSDISGRGVGMDVVRRNVEELQGNIQVQSRPGAGCQVRLRLPLTLSIVEGLTLACGGETYVLPLAGVVELLRPERSSLHALLGHGRALTLRGETIPLLALGELLGLESPRAIAKDAIVAVIESGGRTAGLLVDTVLGQAQVVIKSLDTGLPRSPGVAGATILGDGRIALILDAAGLIASGTKLNPRSQPSPGDPGPVH